MVYGRGTNDPDANSTITKVTRMLWEGTGFGWPEAAFSGVATPLAEPALKRVLRMGFRRVTVFPYFLFTCVLGKRIYAAADRVAAVHPEVEFLTAAHLCYHALVLDCFAERLGGIV